MKRRDFLVSAGLASGGLFSDCAKSDPSPSSAPAIIVSDKLRPQIPFGVQCGDITQNRAIVWSRTDRPARIIVEYSTAESFRNSYRVTGPAALELSDFTARVDLSDLPAGEKIFYRVTFQDLNDLKMFSEPSMGSFRTAPRANRTVSLVWGGDVCGQGWGINPDFGGMKIFETMRALNPDLFVHSGDNIYADNIIQPEVHLDDGSVWRNITAVEKSKVAETIDEFRGNYRYNLMDETRRRFNSEVPVIAQWDDHEVRNNWYPGQVVSGDIYRVKSVELLAAHAKRAFLDYLPIRYNPDDPERIYRAYDYGRSLKLLMLDERSYRGPNSTNTQTVMSDETAFLGSSQINWLKQQLLDSKATWKLIASDMPIGIMVPDVGGKFENWANGKGPALGRELEIADLLNFIKRRKIKNVVWITADVHYAAAHFYDPAKSQFKEFDPFWEFVAGPLHAGTFAPGQMDDTFGPQVKFTSTPQGMKPNRSPKEGLQFFGAVKIDGKTEVMTVSLHDLSGKKLFDIDLTPHS